MKGNKLTRWIKLSRMIYKHNWRYVFGTVLVCFLIYVTRPLLSPVFIQQLFDLLEQNNMSAFLKLGAAMTAAMLCIFGVAYILIVYSDAWFIFLVNRGSVNSYKALFKIPYYETEAVYSKEEQNIRIANGCSGTMGAFAVLTQGITSLVCAGILLILLGRINPWFILLAIVLIGTEAIRMYVESRCNMKYQIQLEKYNAGINGILLTAVMGAEQLVPSGDIKNLLERYYDTRKAMWETQKRKTIMSAGMEVISDTAYTGVLVGVYGLLSFTSLKQPVSIGYVASSGNLFSSFRSNFGLMRNSVTALPGCIVTVERLYEIVASGRTREEKKGRTDQDRQGAAIHIENLCVKDQDKLLLKQINLTIRNGEKTAIIGPNGSGKSTLLKSILGEYSYDSGSITICGEKAEAMIKNRCVSYCPGENQLFSVTAMENIRMGLPADSEPKLAVKEDFLKLLPDQLSEGQRKRVNIYRAVENPLDLCIADEPDASLNKELAKQFINMLCSRSNTLVMVTHNYEWLNLFDKIVIMENGTVKGIYTHLEYVTLRQSKKNELL